MAERLINSAGGFPYYASKLQEWLFYNFSPHAEQTRNLSFPCPLYFTRTTLLHFPHTIFTFDAEKGAALLIICPFSPDRRGRRCFFLRFAPSTTTFSPCKNARRTFAFLPRSFPFMITTVSPLRIFISH